MGLDQSDGPVTQSRPVPTPACRCLWWTTSPTVSGHRVDIHRYCQGRSGRHRPGLGNGKQYRRSEVRYHTVVPVRDLRPSHVGYG